ncbi:MULTISPECIES: hypothetical protein [unclassified Streptomyces]|uniref:hypothetical protein n=1 Tax=unclassified Streptomyces TaxID=2593676 RepID=UPI0037F6E90F
MSSDQDAKHGTCSACDGDARDSSGDESHEGTPCGHPARQQDTPPRDRQITEPRRNR